MKKYSVTVYSKFVKFSIVIRELSSINLELRRNLQEIQVALLKASDANSAPADRKALVQEFLVSREEEIARARRDYHAVADDLHRLQELIAGGRLPPSTSATAGNEQDLPKYPRFSNLDKRPFHASKLSLSNKAATQVILFELRRLSVSLQTSCDDREHFREQVKSRLSSEYCIFV